MRPSVPRVRLLALLVALAPAACVTFGSGHDLAIPKDPKKGVVTKVSAARFPDGTYTGTLRDGYPHGEGRFDYDNGITYEGTFEMGQRQGEGRTVYPSGRVVTGTFKHDADPTTGKIQYPRGPVYEGGIRASSPNGDGVLTRPDGTTLQGSFKGDTVNGFGVYSVRGSEPYWGPLTNGVPNGQGVCGEALCTMQNGSDRTKAVVDDQAKQRTDKALTRETDDALEALDKRHKVEADRASGALRDTQSRGQRLLGPDNRCACTLGTKPCIILKDNSEWNARRSACAKILDSTESRACFEKASHDEKVADIENKKAAAEEKRQCRSDYAQWLGIKDDPAALAREREASREQERKLERELVEEKAAYAKSRTELEERRKQQLADGEERKRVRAKVDADIKAERDKELERLKKLCSGRALSGADCACGGVFKLPPSTSKRAVCKA